MNKLTKKKLEEELEKADDKDHLVTFVIIANKLLENKPDDANMLIRLGSALSRMSRHKEAIEVLEKALGLLPYERMYLAYIKMGHVFKYQYNFKKACEWYQKIIDIRPFDTDGYIYLGSVLARQGNIKEAEKIHRMGIKCEEGCIDEAYYNLGLVLRAQDKLDEAKQCFEKSLEIDPNYKVVKDQLADVVEALSLQTKFNA